MIYINDICNASTKLDFYLLADDTNLLFAVVNSELLNVYDWLNANKQSLNVKKSNFIIFHPYQKRLNYEVNLNIYDNRTDKFVNLGRKEYVKYLGVLIDSNLYWKYHVSHVASKISRNIGIRASLRHFTPFSIFLNIY